jgi:hypothetical protein
VVQERSAEVQKRSAGLSIVHVEVQKRSARLSIVRGVVPIVHAEVQKRSAGLSIVRGVVPIVHAEVQERSAKLSIVRAEAQGVEGRSEMCPYEGTDGSARLSSMWYAATRRQTGTRARMPHAKPCLAPLGRPNADYVKEGDDLF